MVDNYDDTPRLTRKRVNNSKRYAKKIQKEQKDKGEEYHTINGKKILPKSPKPPCSCRQKCFEKFSEDERIQLNRSYWAMGDYTRQRDYLLSNIREVPCNDFEMLRENSLFIINFPTNLCVEIFLRLL